MGNLSMHGYAIYSTHALFCFVLFFNLACEQDDQIHDKEHTDADGFVLEDESGVQIYSELEGDIEGSITITPGDTLELSVHFLDHDGDEIEHDEKEDKDELSVSENDSNIAIVSVEEHEEGEENHHEMAIQIIGVSSGSTSCKLQLMHDGHADYTSTNNVPITVK